MESHMKMLDYSLTLWREVVEASYDFRRHQRECEHLNFLTLSKVRVSTLRMSSNIYFFRKIRRMIIQKIRESSVH
jgi:hypothetical protein